VIDRSERTLAQRALFVVRGFIVALIGVGLTAPTLIGAMFISALTLSGDCGDGTPPPVPHEAVRFPSSASGTDSTPAYFVPGSGRAGAVVLIVPTNQARGARAFEWMAYHDAGYHILTFTGRGCLSGVNTLGYMEALQVGDALAYLATRPDVDMNRIGAHGFSQAGAAALMAAARYPAVRGVVAQGGYHDFGEELAHNAASERLGILGGLFTFGGRLAYRLRTGWDVGVLSPISVIGQIAPRPILLIYGANEPGLRGARLQLAAAGENAELWEVEGAGHGDYAAAAGDDYARRIVAFMDRALE
jgi:hypothetical protein